MVDYIESVYDQALIRLRWLLGAYVINSVQIEFREINIGSKDTFCAYNINNPSELWLNISLIWSKSVRKCIFLRTRSYAIDRSVKQNCMLLLMMTELFRNPWYHWQIL